MVKTWRNSSSYTTDKTVRHLSSEDGAWLPMRPGNENSGHSRNVIRVECILQCTTARNLWEAVLSWGALQQQQPIKAHSIIRYCYI